MGKIRFVINANVIFKVVSLIIIYGFLFSMGIESPLYLALVSINSAITVNEIFSREKEAYSLQKVINFFVLFFFVLANAIQYSEGSAVTSFDMVFDEEDYCMFQIVVLFILLGYNLLYHLFRFSVNGRMAVNLSDMSASSHCRIGRLICLSALATVAVVFMYRNNLAELFFRGIVDELSFGLGDDDAGIAEMGQMSTLVFEHLVRNVPAVAYLVAIQAGASKKSRFALFFLFLLVDSPTALPRNAAAMLWIPVLVMKFGILRKPNIFMSALVGGLLVVFPFLDIFRNFSGKISFVLSLDFLNSMHFDASQMFMSVLKLDRVTFGRQLAGALLFFVPRRFWPGKPIGSGGFIAEDFGAFSNVSMPYFGEGFINFGIAGILLFVIFLSCFTGYFDKRYFMARKNSSLPRSAFSGCYLYLVGAILFVMRGDLMSSYAYTMGLVVTYIIVYRLTVKAFYAQTSSD